MFMRNVLTDSKIQFQNYLFGFILVYAFFSNSFVPLLEDFSDVRHVNKYFRKKIKHLNKHYINNNV